jgi:Zn finger protein HypA/HybF involved in hydrogenase expression
MAIKCLECNGIIKGSSIPWKCPLCGNKNIIKFTRVDDVMTDHDQQMHERDKAFLEGRRV